MSPFVAALLALRDGRSLVLGSGGGIALSATAPMSVELLVSIAGAKNNVGVSSEFAAGALE